MCTYTAGAVRSLGLDYDIFLMDSVMEQYDKGLSGREAVIKALDHTGTVIAAAGIVMFLAFGAIMLGATPVLQQMAFMLSTGVLLDCFVTTKLLIPALMSLVPGDGNFWPRTRALASGATAQGRGRTERVIN